MTEKLNRFGTHNSFEQQTLSRGRCRLVIFQVLLLLLCTRHRRRIFVQRVHFAHERQVVDIDVAVAKCREAPVQQIHHVVGKRESHHGQRLSELRLGALASVRAIVIGEERLDEDAALGHCLFDRVKSGV